MPIKLPFRPRRETFPPHLWTQCPSCEEMLFNKQLDKLMRVCPNCGHHFRLSASARLEHLVDPGTFAEHDAGLESKDPLAFVDQKAYPDRVAAAQLATGLRDAAIWGETRIGGRAAALVVMDFGFMGGSMGAVVGEKIARAAEFALAERIPLVTVAASGGARMQEGTLALMQLPKTVAAVERLREAGVPYISILSDPTTGGVFASFSALGDVNVAEPNALIGFAGARVSAGTIAQELPPGFQRAEFLFEHGFVDRVVHRAALRDELIALLSFLQPADPSSEATSPFRPFAFLAPRPDGPDGSGRASTNGRAPGSAGARTHAHASGATHAAATHAATTHAATHAHASGATHVATTHADTTHAQASGATHAHAHGAAHAHPTGAPRATAAGTTVAGATAAAATAPGTAGAAGSDATAAGDAAPTPARHEKASPGTAHREHPHG